MTDVFDTKILCKKCNVEMQHGIIKKEGAELRAVVCPKCQDKIIHPADLNCLNHFNNLKDKTFTVKMRMVGNSHAISIPKEIVDFINEQRSMMNDNHRNLHHQMDEMVRLALDDFRRLSLSFPDIEEEENER